MESLNLIVLSTASWLSWGGVSMFDKKKKFASFFVFLVVWLLCPLWKCNYNIIESSHWKLYTFFDSDDRSLTEVFKLFDLIHILTTDHTTVKRITQEVWNFPYTWKNFNSNSVHWCKFFFFFSPRTGYWRFCLWKCGIPGVKNYSKGTSMKS